MLELLGARRDGKFVYYRLADEAPLDLLAALSRLTERNVAEVERLMRRYFRDRDGLEPVPRAALLERILAGTVTVLDVRPDDEFALGHLPSAVNIPLKDIEARAQRTRSDTRNRRLLPGALLRPIFPGGHSATQPRYVARCLEDGLPEWRAAGLPVVADHS